MSGTMRTAATARDEASSPSPTSELQDHLYQSFLLGQAADITLDVHAPSRWSAQYRLHRVVLTQAVRVLSDRLRDHPPTHHLPGFLPLALHRWFSRVQPWIPSSSHDKAARFQHLQIWYAVYFLRPDSPFHTFAAFEFCLARLYGGGPPLHVPISHSSADGQEDPPLDHLNASPSFLMSLLATTTYLSAPSLAHLAISTIISTISPSTVVDYLNFALGEPIKAIHLLDEHPAGLESVAGLLSSAISIASEVSYSEYTGTSSRMEADCANDKSTASKFDSKHYYGVLSDRVGHACACWLARWGIDILEWEAGPGADNGPRIWRRGGLSPQWIRAILSSNFFFSKSEWHRYDAAKKVVELRRREGVMEDEELVWGQLFENGVIYAHMSFSQLQEIANDISPTTNRLFVKASTVHSANWIATNLRHLLTARHSPSPGVAHRPLSPSSPVSRDKELGITHDIKEIRAQLNCSALDAPSLEQYHVPSDAVESFFAEPENSSTAAPFIDDHIFSNTHTPWKSKLKSFKDYSSHADYFGIYEQSQTAMHILSQNANEATRWTPFPPLRFGVEFWDLCALREKTRLHSQTVWYAGSLFNVYTLVIRKKGVLDAQLGIYLHRQSSVEPLPLMSSRPPVGEGPLSFRSLGPLGPFLGSGTASDRVSSPNQTVATSMNAAHETLPLDTRIKLSINADGTGTFSRGSTPSTSRPASANTGASPPYLTNSPSPDQPFRDPRPSVAAYFVISCASPAGASTTKFSSGPDVFGIGQSWGWKTSSFRSEEYLDASGRAKKSLRATVMIGLV